MEWTDSAPVHDMLDNENTEFVVIGAIGAQNTGKSTLLSMIGGNDAFDLYRQYIFRPASREAVETCHHQTGGVQMYVTPTRVVLLDCQAVFSLSALDDVLRSGDYRRSNYDTKLPENSAEIESLQLLAFMMDACHVLLLCADWFIDMNVVRSLRLASTMRPTQAQTVQEQLNIHPRRCPVLGFVHQRGKSDDFQMVAIRERCRFLKKIFEGSDFNVSTGISMSRCSLPPYCGWIERPTTDDENERKTTKRNPRPPDPLADVNYFVLSDMKLRTSRTDDTNAAAVFDVASPRIPVVIPSVPGMMSWVPDYELLIDDLRELVRRQPHAPFLIAADGQTPQTLTEKNWLTYASRSWDIIRKSNVHSEFARFLY